MTTSGDKPRFESDPMMDACLDEVLGGQSPPDLSARILKQLEGQSSHVEHPSDEADPIQTDELRPRIVTRDVAPRAGNRAEQKRNVPAWAATIGLCVLGIIGTLAVLYSPSAVDSPSPIAESPDAPTTPDDEASPSAPSWVPAIPDRELSEPNPATQDPPVEPPKTDSAKPPTKPNASRLVSLDDHQMIAQINDQLRRQWQVVDVSPTKAIDDENWCQRAFVQLIGRAPGRTEKSNFVRDHSPQKKQQLVDRLVGPDYADAFAEHWSNLWSDWLLEQSSAREDEQRIFRSGLAAYMASALKEHRPYDALFQQLLIAKGTNEPGRKEFDGATNYLLAVLDNDRVEVTAHICRTMMGTRIRCAQCHDDPQNRLPQERFWQISAVFHDVKSTRLRLGRGRMMDGQGVGEIPFQTADGSWQETTPASIDGRPIVVDDSGTVREQFASRLIESPQFPRAAVNRIWSELLRFGFTFPVDDLGPHNPVSHPQLVDLLATQFAASDYDFRRLVRWVVLSEAFDRGTAITDGNSIDFPDGGTVALFSRSYVRPPIFGSPVEGLDWLASGGAPQVTNSQDEASRSVIQGLRSGSNPTEGAVSKMGQLLPISQLRIVRSLANQGMSFDQQLQHAFLMTLDRTPTAAEQAQAGAIFEAANKDQIIALERIFWALLNTR